ncbi:hypothetical protein COU74_01370 [Candidatus Peregrinibacteria bacterium CG10_big_fil_rev_8_21_14_0_10_36_19]|nr:MAG: hypothetical protein COU74_01370 [Candidatus Peregrinibacteria bacterium CG10_big_fil_rev_8_21_14_0_10_36_19]
MSQLILNNGLSRKNLFSRFVPSVEAGPYFLLFSLVLFVGLVTVVTLMFSARQVTKGYVLSSLEVEHQELIREGNKMDMQISEVRALNRIEQSPKVRRMIRPGQTAYVHADTAIAQK